MFFKATITVLVDADGIGDADRASMIVSEELDGRVVEGKVILLAPMVTKVEKV